MVCLPQIQSTSQKFKHRLGEIFFPEKWKPTSQVQEPNSTLSGTLGFGSCEATEHLKQHCLKHVCLHVYAPQLEETIDVTSDLCAYKVQLSEKPMSDIIFKKLGENEIAWFDSEVSFAGGALRCGEHVTIRKVGDASHKGGGADSQQIVIEGPA
ncbi:hypothetical protein ACLB2K_044464 [Fragaria x ananassa]